MWSPLKESHFDLLDSSMSAAVQELYAGLPVALSSDRSALLDPTVVLDVAPETPTFVLSCSSGLPSEHQITYGLKICSQDTCERPDYVDQMSGPRPRELISKEPEGTGVLAKNEEFQNVSPAEQDCLPGLLREDAGMAKGKRGFTEEGLGCFAPASKAACGSEEKEPRLMQAGREFLPRHSLAERADSLQSSEENQANVHVTAENPPSPMKEAPGRKADGTVLFGKAGKSSPQASPGVLRECSDVETLMAKVEVSETSTVVSLEPVSVVDDALAKEYLQGEEEGRRGPRVCAASSAATSALLVSETGGEMLLNQDQEVGSTLGHVLSSHQDQANLQDDGRSASELESRLTIDTQLTDTVHEMPNSLFQGFLEFGHVPWEEDMDVFEVICNTWEECPLSDNKCLWGTASNTKLVEMWASQRSAGENLLPAYSREELPSDSEIEEEIGNRMDHSYSCVCEGAVEIEKGNAMQSSQEEAQASSHSKNGQQEWQICQFSKEENTHPNSNTSFLLDAGHPSPQGLSDDDLNSVPLGSDSVQRDEHQRSPLPQNGRLAIVQEENASLWEEASDSMCSQSSGSTCTLSHPTCQAPFGCDCKSCKEPLWQVESASNQRTKISASAASLHADNSSSLVDVLISNEDNPPAVQPSDEHSFTPESGLISSPGGFLNSLPEESFSGTCAKLGRQGAGGLLCNRKELPPARQHCGSCTDRSEKPQHCAAPGFCDAEKTDKAGCTILGNVCLGDQAQKMRTETNAEQVDGLEMHPDLVSAAGLPQEHNGVGVQDSPSCKSSHGDLDRVESNSLCSVWMSSASFSGAEALGSYAEAQGQRMEDDYCMNTEEMLGVDNCIGPPDTSLEQELIATSSVAGPGGIETVDSEKLEEEGHGNGVNEKPRGDRHVDKIVHLLELGGLVKDKGKEEPGKLHVPPSSFAPDLSSLKTCLKTAPPGLVQEQGCPLRLEDLSAEDWGQPREAVCQQESHAPVQHHGHLHSPISWNWESETTQREVLEGQQPLSIICSRQERDGAVQTVTCSEKETKKSACCSQDESLCLKSDGNRTLQAPVLVMQNDVQQTFQQHCFSNKTESESVGDLLKGEPVELKNPDPSSECLECASQQLELNGSAKEWTGEVKRAEFCSSSPSFQASPSDVQDKNHSLNSEPPSPSNQGYFHLAPNPLARTNSQIEDPSTSPYPNDLCCPPVQKYPALTVSLEREDDCHINSLTSGNDKGSCPPRGGVRKGSPSCSKEQPRSVTGSKAGAAMLGEIVCATPSKTDSARKIKPSLEDHLREGSQAAEEMDVPVCSLSSSVDSSGFSSQGWKHIAGEEEVAVLGKAESCTRLPFDSFELGQSEEPASVKDPSRTAVPVWHLEDVAGCARLSKDPLPTKTPGVLHSAVPWMSLGGNVLEASPKCFRSQGRCWQSTVSSQKVAGVKRKFSAHMVSKWIEVPVESKSVSEIGEGSELAAKALRKEAGGCPSHSVTSYDRLRPKTKGTAEHLLKRRLLKVWQPLGSSLLGVAVKPEVPTQQTSAAGCVIEGSKNKSAWSTLQELKRPKIPKDLIELECMEARSSCFSVENCGRTSVESNIPFAPVSSKWPKAAGCGHDGIQSAFGSACKMRQSLMFSRPLGKVWRKVSGPGQFNAARKSNPVRSPACLKNRLALVSQHKSNLVDCVYSAMPAGAIKKARPGLWSQAPKQRACQSSWLGPRGFGQLTKDQAVLRRLSTLADKLLAPPRNPQELKPPWHSTRLLPVAGQGRPLLSQKLLDIFSCVDMKLNSLWMNDSTCCSNMSSSPSLALYPLESLNLCFWDLGHKAPLSFSAPPLPVSFHIKVGPFPARSLLGITSLQSIPHRVVTGERSGTLRPSSWTLSFLFSQSCLGSAPVEEGTWSPTESSLSAKKDRGEDTVAQRSTGCPLHGLQTTLALLSPRCYRLWTRKQTLTRRTPAAQKLTLLQFAQSLKGLKRSLSASANLFSSVSSSLGRVLSIWNQHSPSSHPSEHTPLHTSHGMWQPVSPATTGLGLGISSSSAMLPQVPDRILRAPRAVTGAVRLEPPFPASLPTFCSVSEPALSALGLSAPDFKVHPLDELDVSDPVLPKTGTRLEKADSARTPKKVSQIRIRKTIPKPDPNLTPMGLPRPKRLKKKEFSLEEIYTNKNYKSPPASRCLETIFEEPKERNGSLISVSQQKRKRILEFQDFTIPRKRRMRSRVKVLGSSTRAQKAALEGRELDVLLIQKLTDLEAFFAEEEEKEQTVDS